MGIVGHDTGQHIMEESAAERRARLKAMREAAAQDKDDGPAQEEPERPAAEPSSQQAGPSKPAQPLLKLRNYNLKDQASIPHTNVRHSIVGWMLCSACIASCAPAAHVCCPGAGWGKQVCAAGSPWQRGSRATTLARAFLGRA